MISGDTIAAISSAIGPAARIIVRLSGPGTGEIVGRVGIAALPAPACAARVEMRVRGLEFSAWICRFQSPRSYTGEDLIELHIPGNPLLARLVLEELLRAGARAAEPGEFTARAYFNGRLDLTEAEGVAATIAAGNEQELSAARRLLSGELSRRLAPVMDRVAQTLALLEVGIDFSDEDVTFISASQTAEQIAAADELLRELLEQSVRFERLAHEPNVLLVGRPNAGKSTLLNALAGHERAVVSPLAGTTRDVLSAEVALARGVVRLTDVAGIESPDDERAAEAEDEHQRIDQSMRRHALRALEEADHVVLVRDVLDDRPALPLSRAPDLVVMSKMDLCSGPMQSDEARDAGAASVESNSFDRAVPRTIHISAARGVGLDALREALDRLCFGESSRTAALALNARHVQAIEEARAALQAAQDQAADGGAELVAMDLREALDALGRVSGKISPDDLLGRIFSAFCIGK